jgi:hypothetical protein
MGVDPSKNESLTDAIGDEAGAGSEISEHAANDSDFSIELPPERQDEIRESPDQARTLGAKTNFLRFGFAGETMSEESVDEEQFDIGGMAGGDEPPSIDLQRHYDSFQSESAAPSSSPAGLSTREELVGDRTRPSVENRASAAAGEQLGGVRGHASSPNTRWRTKPESIEAAPSPESEMEIIDEFEPFGRGRAVPAIRAKVASELADFRNSDGAERDLKDQQPVVDEAVRSRVDEKSAERGVRTWRRATATPNASRLVIGDRDELLLEGMQVNVLVDGFRARVLLDLYYFNNRGQQLEGNFKLRLPNEAS